MGFSLEDAQEAIIAHLEEEFVQPIHEQGIADIDTVRRVNGDIEPYIALSFGQPREQGGKSMIGPWGHDYVLPIYMQVIAPTPRVARQLGNKLVRVMIGVDFPWTGQVRQMSGGPILPITQSNGATEAYMQPMSFGVVLQLNTW